MSLRTELISLIYQASEGSNPLGDHAEVAYCLGQTNGYVAALNLAEQHGVADGEDWKAKYDAAEAATDTVRQQLHDQLKENQRLSIQLQTAEQLLGALVPDAPEEGIVDPDDYGRAVPA